MDWEELWKSGNIPWDLNGPSPPLLEYLRGKGRLGDSVLVPGCGSGHDLRVLSAHYDHVVGMDISESAVSAATDNARGIDNVTCILGNFFTFKHNSYDAVFDYTFFCAIPVEKRSEWGRVMRRIVGKKLLIIAFPIGTANLERPPYPVTVSNYQQALGDEFEITHLNETPDSHPSRLGKEMMVVFSRRHPIGY